MTAIGGYMAATRRPGLLGVHSVGEFVLAVPDVAKAQDFYGAFGLDARAQGNQLSLHTVGDGYRWGRVVEGARKETHHLSFHCWEEDLPRFRAHLEGNGIRLLDPPPGFDSNGLWFRDMDGKLLEIRVGAKTQPDEKTPMELAPTATGTRNAPYRRNAGRSGPTRLSHVVHFTPDVLKAIDFYHRILGLRLSDRSGDIVAFMHAVHGSDHHVVAFAKSGAPGMHHLSWDVPTVNDIGLGVMAMADRGYDRGWGFGRHVLGSNYFHYVRDPWGSYCEYSSDMDYVPSSMDWEGKDHPPEDGFYLWGPNPPADFVHNYEGDAR
ncbi:VOC family protein [Roseomonas populi]|uniref:VOC family protein n=1 Tax=Roseomonas populi TaxID=3121582 RepID=A0ABT1XD02_9PROT|nr:VOC family protein [Roseomonas pecuniae]MCR0985621.1 VOC family protein [Roseomonas pecuniae]